MIELAMVALSIVFLCAIVHGLLPQSDFDESFDGSVDELDRWIDKEAARKERNRVTPLPIVRTHTTPSRNTSLSDGLTSLYVASSYGGGHSSCSSSSSDSGSCGGGGGD